MSAFIAVCLLSVGCDKSGSSSNSPGLLESVAGDVEHEIDGAPDTAEQVGSDASGGANDVVDGVAGPSSSSSTPPAETDDAAASAESATDEAP